MTVSLDGIALPTGLVWSDELSHDPVAQERTTTTTGALVVEESASDGWFPVTLIGLDDSAWIVRSDLLALRALADQPGSEVTLNLHGTEYVAAWNRVGGQAIEARPLVDYEQPADSDFYVLQAIRLIALRAL